MATKRISKSTEKLIKRINKEAKKINPKTEVSISVIGVDEYIEKNKNA